MAARRIACAVALALALLIAISVCAFAQSTVSDVHIYSVDVSQFPVIRVRVAPILSDGMVASGLTADAFRVYESGAERLVHGDDIGPVEEGTQVAIVLDASGSINKPGATGELRKDEAVHAIDELVMEDTWIDREKRLDRVMLMVPKGTDHYEIIQEWTDDYVRVHNQAYLYEYQKQKTDTALYAMLVEAMARMKDVPGYEGRNKFIVVFSDGIDRTSAKDITDVINRAERGNVTIMSIKLGPEGTGEAKNLRRMAEMTGGAFTTYTGTQAPGPLYSIIRSRRMQYEVSYQSAIVSSSKHTLKIGVLWDGREVKSPPIELSVAVQPPAVRIVEPVPDTVYERKSDQWDVDPKTLEPREQPITIDLSWPDRHPRNVQQVSYIVDGVVIAALQPEADQPYLWDFSEMPAGVHSIEVEVKDELGMVGESDAVQVTINIDIPSPPTPTPPPPVETVVARVVTEKVIPQVEEQLDDKESRDRLWDAVTLGGAGLAIVLALYVLIRRPQVVRDVTGALVGAVMDATDIFFPRRRKERRAASAFLIPVTSDGSPGEAIPITAQSVLLGRDPSQAQMTFADKSVSRLHARIVEEADSVFRIYDEGSSSGTYVNSEEVFAEGHHLKPGDEIDMGRLRLIFQTQLAQGTDETGALVPETQDGDETEAFVSRGTAS